MRQEFLLLLFLFNTLVEFLGRRGGERESEREKETEICGVEVRKTKNRFVNNLYKKTQVYSILNIYIFIKYIKYVIFIINILQLYIILYILINIL